LKKDVILVFTKCDLFFTATCQFNEFQKSLFWYQRVHRSVDLKFFLNKGKTVAISRDHPCLARSNDKLGPGKRKARLFIGDRERSVLNEVGKGFRRYTHRCRFERRYLRKLFA